MRVALVHDYLNQYGGGERVLEVLMEMFPAAPVYTILHDGKKTAAKFAARVAGTSFLNFQFVKDHHRLFIPLMPKAAESLFLGDQYDLIISDTAGYAKGITYNPETTKHISYIHTPLRYAWEAKDYFSNKIFTAAFSDLFNYLKNWDYQAAQRPDLLIANSAFIAGKIKKYYGREAKLAYPPVDISRFYREVKSSKLKAPSYYLAAGRFMRYKRFDLIIDAFANLGYWLKIVGSGPEKESLAMRINELGAANIELLPLVGDDELCKLYNGAKAFIFPQVEDFGLVAAEAQACGTPVIAYAAGGALEIVEDGETGILFKEQTPNSLIEAVQRFEKTKFSRVKISQSAKRFSKENFQKKIFNAVSSV